MFAIAITHRARRAPCRLSCSQRARGGGAKRTFGICGPFRAHRAARFFIPTCRTKANGPAGASTRLFLRVRASLCAYPRKKCTPTSRARLHGRARGRVCTGPHLLAPISIIHPSVQPTDSTGHTCARECARARARGRADEPRPRRQVPFTHTLARKQIPGLSRIY